MFYGSKEYNILLAKPTMKSRGSSFFNDKTRQKNAMIMRHIFERMVEHFGPWDGLRHAVNYTSSGEIIICPWGANSPFDAHVVKWQHELFKEGLIEAKEMLSPGSVAGGIGGVIFSKKVERLDQVRKLSHTRRPARDAGWLLACDQAELEKLNYPDALMFKVSRDDEIEVGDED